MIDVELYQWTIVVALGFVAIEILTGTFLFLGFAIGTLPVVFVHLQTNEIDWGRDLMTFAIVSTIGFLILRRLFHNKNDQKRTESDVNQY